jgi:site-specific recombinase XerD
MDDALKYRVHLASKGVAWLSLNRTVASLRFFYGVTPAMAEVSERITDAREPPRLPVMLSADEMVLFLEAVPA